MDLFLEFQSRAPRLDKNKETGRECVQSQFVKATWKRWAFRRWELNPCNSQKVGGTSERPRRGIQRGFVGAAVGERQGGLSAATRAGHCKRKWQRSREGVYSRLLGSRYDFAGEEKQRSGRLIIILKIGESAACFDEAWLFAKEEE